MKLKELMAAEPVCISPEESVSVASRMLARCNIGCLPVCGRDGGLLGVVTDRDLVVRCLASGKKPEETRVREIMTTGIVSVGPDVESKAAAKLMGRQQIRRLPVVEQGKLCGMISLADLANRAETAEAAAEALKDISNGLSVRD